MQFFEMRHKPFIVDFFVDVETVPQIIANNYASES